jgi:hypothetical protein
MWSMAMKVMASCSQRTRIRLGQAKYVRGVAEWPEVGPNDVNKVAK